MPISHVTLTFTLPAYIPTIFLDVRLQRVVMAATAIGVTSGVMGIMAFTYASVKGLYEFIESIKGADHQLDEVTTNLNDVACLLKSLETETQTPSAEYSPNTIKALQSLNRVLNHCQSECDGFKRKLTKIMPSSAGTKISLFDRIKLNFHQEEVGNFEKMLEQWKLTISGFVSLATLRTSTTNSERLTEIERMFSLAIKDQEEALKLIDGDIQTMMRFGQELLIPMLEKQKAELEECKEACLKGLEATPAPIGTTIKNASAHDRAMQVLNSIGDVKAGGPTVLIHGMTAHDDSHQYGGAMSVEAIDRILKNRRLES